MHKDIYTPRQIQMLLQPVFADYKVKKAILFGSYAKGKVKEQSDIDILVDSGLKGLSFFGLLEDVVTTLGKKVDLLDVSQIAQDSQISEEIKKSGGVIYNNKDKQFKTTLTSEFTKNKAGLFLSYFLILFF